MKVPLSSVRRSAVPEFTLNANHSADFFRVEIRNGAYSRGNHDDRVYARH